MREISKKHWIVFLILFLYEVLILVFLPVISTSFIAGFTLSILSVWLMVYAIF